MAHSSRLVFTLLCALALPSSLTGCAMLQGRFHDSEEDKYRSAYNPIDDAVRNQDLITGMQLSDVKRAWGSPMDVEVAGEHGAGYERWTYSSAPISASGYSEMGMRRVVYFEEGRVVGWETLR